MSTEALTKSHLLRRSLQWNAGFSMASGIVLIIASEGLGPWLGVPLQPLLIGIGAMLIFFALALLLHARRPQLSLREAKATVLMDLLWVIGSIVLLLWPDTPLTVQGRWFIGIIADIVALFALLQWVGIKRLQR